MGRLVAGPAPSDEKTGWLYVVRGASWPGGPEVGHPGAFLREQGQEDQGAGVASDLDSPKIKGSAVTWAVPSPGTIGPWWYPPVSEGRA